MTARVRQVNNVTRKSSIENFNLKKYTICLTKTDREARTTNS